MKPLLQLGDIKDDDRRQVGGKAFALARLYQHNIRVPKTFCVPCYVYDAYLSATRLRDRILLEINRKEFEKMRWEEIWDISLRVRNFFLITPIPARIRESLSREISHHCKHFPVAVRSSAPGEDDRETSFAGLHESFLNVTGTDNILKHIKLVWASLYSDAALLYRKELGLDINTSTMAVVVQELIPSESSGVFFSVNPSDAGQSVLEAVHGLNQGLVDGDIDPDRWIMDRSSGKIINHSEPLRNQYAASVREGISIQGLPEGLKQKPPLNESEIQKVWETGKKAETLFQRPQDMEWTFSKDRLVILQTRPITSTGFKDSDDKRSWYLTLHRSYENLKKLHKKIEAELIPKMVAQAEKMGRKDLSTLTNRQLAREIKNRQDTYDYWVQVYWADFIPFAHGIRLFGQVYNDAIRPNDPYEFMRLLEKTNLKSIERNRLLEKLAGLIQKDPGLKDKLAQGEEPAPGHQFAELLQEFISKFGDLSCQTGGAGECLQGNAALIRLLLEYARLPLKKALQQNGADIDLLKKNYTASFPAGKQSFAEDVLRLGRASYRLRDDDNIHLGRIEARMFEAVREGQSRLAEPGANTRDLELLTSLPALAPAANASVSSPEKPVESEASDRWLKVRQIVGNPAGPGIAKGRARLIRGQGDLLEFKQGEILICQGVDPNMTFVVPLSSAVVEERGGMLIHGAIIAREYGLPCVTGAPGITRLIKTGDVVTVDGYLGIVTCETGELGS